MAGAEYKIDAEKLTCYHCGEDCKEEKLVFDEKNFCCNGCKTVYEILKTNNLCNYYDLNNTPGASLKNKFHEAKYQYLDEEDVVRKIVKFDNGAIQKVVFQIPYIHCSSCIYLLEKLPFIQPAVKNAQVNFLKKQLTVTYSTQDFSLRKMVELLANIGYDPAISLNDIENETTDSSNTQYYIRLGVAFFCFGNVMLLSFPEYLGIDFLQEAAMRKFFGYVNLFFGLPLLFFSASPFFSSAYHALRQRTLNMDVPIVLGMVVMYIRSVYDVFVHHGGGYIDTLASLTFLMLVGRLFQNKTYDILRFDRDFKSYFPVSVTIVENKTEKSIALNKLKVGDTILIRNQELIPADAVLISEEATIDYSFVTGEAVPNAQRKNDTVFAGGKNIGHNIQLVVEKNVSHSYLTQLWNDQSFKKDEQKKITTLSLAVSRWFTPVILLISFAVFGYWFWQNDLNKAANGFTAILIITCPCALALSSPFTLGNILRLLGRAEMYLKNNIAVEMLAAIDTIVFDKTGTLSSALMTGVNIEIPVGEEELSTIKSITKNSTHPLSRKITTYLKDKSDKSIAGFAETEGKGISAKVEGNEYKIGSKKWLGIEQEGSPTDTLSSYVYVTKNDKLLTRIALRNEYRSGIEALLSGLKKNYEVYVLSGDNDYAKNYLSNYVDEAHLHFYQSPQNKLDFVQSLQKKGKKVMMIGDGLNDAGALKSSDMGIAIADDLNNFSPACDAIIKGDRLIDLPNLLSLAKTGVHIIKISFFASFVYNLIGIYFAAQGTMTPLVAAILMPISSVSIIAFTTLSTIWFFNRKFR